MDSKSSIAKNEDGSFEIRIPKPTKVQQAYAIYYIWLHEVGFELQKDAHESWKGYTKNTIAEYRKIRDTMTEEEKKEIDSKATLFHIKKK